MRKGAETTDAVDPVLSPPPSSPSSPEPTFADALAVIQRRALERLCLVDRTVAEQGVLTLWMWANDHQQRRLGSATLGRSVAVDAGNWEAVRVMLAQGRGELVLEVLDVPKGWMVIEAGGRSRRSM